VPVRVIIDQRAFPSMGGAHPVDETIVNNLKAAGIPIRQRSLSNSYILHWKTMIFAGQNTVEFSGANYSPTAFVPQTPYADYEDEAIYFSDDPSIVNSFKTKYDDLWTDTTNYADYANITSPPARVYPTYPKDPQLNFPQQESYASRLLGRYTKETAGLDVIMFRITDERETNAVIQTYQRGIPVRLYTDTDEYRDPSRQWVSYNMDKLYAAGVPIKVRAHAGLNHQKLVLFYSQGMAVFGSSNWTSPSDKGQQEHNMFSTKPWIFSWFHDQFERKWNNAAPTGAQETTWFTPLPPDKPVGLAPANGATGQLRSLELQWDGGYYGQIYDVYFGTDPNPPLYAANLQLGPKDYDTGATQKLGLPLLNAGTTYYWRVVGKTMAGLTAKSPIYSFTTAGVAPPPSAPPSGASTVVMWTATDVSPSSIYGNWQFTTDGTAAGGTALWNPNRSTAKISPPLASPDSYFEVTFSAVAGVPYHLWLRLKAQSNSLDNNSVSVQFTDSIDQYGSPLYRIGTTQGAEVVLQDPSGTLAGWGWDDNGFGGPATPIYFATSGTHTLRVQQRNDGAMIDQIVLSPDAFFTTPPGTTKNDTTIYGSTLDGAAPPTGGSFPPAQPPLPTGWQDRDIGAVGLPGYAEIDQSSTFSVVGAGADVWGTADALHYAYTSLTGDGTIVARVTGVSNVNQWVKAGVMIRETTAPGSTQAFMLLSYSKGTAFQRRKVTGSSSSSTTGSTSAVAPYWLRLDRAGDLFTAYQSADGVTWKKVGSDTIPMASSVLIGLGVSSHTVDAAAMVTFDQVSINGTPVTAACTYYVNPGELGVAADAGAVSTSVSAGSSCAWTAASNVPWITVTGGASGSGNGTVSLNVAANTGGSRSGTVTIAGQTLTIEQAAASCGFTLTPASKAMATAGDSATITVSAAGWCDWSATSSDPSWLTITSGATGTGSGTVAVAASANSGGARSATVSIGDQVFTATQAAAPCTYSISPASQSVAPQGTSVSVAVTAASWCSWSATANAAWLTVTGGASGMGSGSVAVSVAANGGAARTATVTIAGQTFTVTQAAPACTYAISPGSASLAAGGGNTSVAVSTGSWCSWTATSSDPTWLTVTSGASGTGNGTVIVSASVNSGTNRTATVAIAGQTFTATQSASSLAAGWSQQDVGVVDPAGDATWDGTTYAVTASGADIWGTVDAMHFVYRTLAGDGSIVARVSSIQNVSSWTKAGVMIRESLDPASVNAYMLVSRANGLAFQVRSATGGTTTSTPGSSSAAPYWVRLDRAGSTITAYQSPDGVIWTLVGADTVAMASTVYVGLAVTSHSAGTAATATLDSLNVTAGTPASPTPWMHRDIGAVGAAGSATFSPATGTYTVKGSGADIWGSADAFHYLYRPMTGDGVIVARVATVSNTNAWVKAGVMIRETLDPASAQAMALVSYSKGLAFPRRTATGGASTSTAGPLAAAPYWVKLERIGSTINAYASTDGAAWTLIGSDTFAMAPTVYVGLAVSSHTTAAATATFDNVTAP
jgi:regulation of enolase protein 1 (concanavalin A-like superfamily)